MKLKISSRAKLFKIRFCSGGWLTTYCLARSAKEAHKVFFAEYAHEYRNKKVELNIKQLKPNDKNDEWKWYESAFSGRNGSILLAPSLIISSHGKENSH